MEPTLLDGDRLRFDPGAYRLRPPVAGELVVVRDPELPERWLVKRLGSVDGDRVALLSDNPDVGRDSRQFGTVARGSLLGQVYERYDPVDRRTRL